MVKRGTPLEFIVEDTGLSFERVEKIAKKYNNGKGRERSDIAFFCKKINC